MAAKRQSLPRTEWSKRMPEKKLLRPDSVILVTGGGRGITAECAIEAARVGHSRFILLGRTRLDTPEPDWASPASTLDKLKLSLARYSQASGQKLKPVEIQRACGAVMARRDILSTMELIRAAGGQVEYFPADVSSPATVQSIAAILAAENMPVTGIIHGAGALADKRIENKTLADFESVVNPKVKGLANLLACIPASQLEFLVLFSSIVSVSGNPGQTDYGIANRILDAAARRIQIENPACRVLSINWGPWESGMVSPALKAYFNSHGIELISLKDGARQFLHLLNSPALKAKAQIIVGGIPPRAVRKDPASNQIIKRTLQKDENLFLEDHRIGSQSVLPATCAASWMAYSAEQVFPGLTAARMDEFKVLKGLVFSDHDAREFITHIRKVDSTDGRIKVDVTVSSETGKNLPLYHYRAQFVLSRSLPANHERITPDDPAPEGSMDGEQLYRDGTCFHGPAFQGIRQVYHLNETGLWMTACLNKVPAHTQGQFPVRFVNPYLNDVIVQSLLVWTQKHLQAPCLPSYARTVQQFLPAGFDTPYLVRLQVRDLTDTTVTGDIYVWDDQKKLVLQITGLQGTISRQLKRLMTVQTSANVSIQP